jgi:hypothetical protein
VYTVACLPVIELALAIRSIISGAASADWPGFTWMWRLNMNMCDLLVVAVDH